MITTSPGHSLAGPKHEWLLRVVKTQIPDYISASLHFFSVPSPEISFCACTALWVSQGPDVNFCVDFWGSSVALFCLIPHPSNPSHYGSSKHQSVSSDSKTAVFCLGSIPPQSGLEIALREKPGWIQDLAPVFPLALRPQPCIGCCPLPANNCLIYFSTLIYILVGGELWYRLINHGQNLKSSINS